MESAESRRRLWDRQYQARGLVMGALAVADNRETVSSKASYRGRRAPAIAPAASVMSQNLPPTSGPTPHDPAHRPPERGAIPVDAVLRPVARRAPLLCDAGRTRDRRGQPRFTLLGIGPATGRRVFTPVWQWIQAGAFRGNGFQLSTRHVGIDFENGVSLVQARRFPDRFDVIREALYCCNAPRRPFLLVPSARGVWRPASIATCRFAGRRRGG